MWLEQALSSLQNTGLTHFVDRGRYFTMGIQTFHILAFTLLLAVALTLALRVQGWTLRTLPVARLAALLRLPYRLALMVALAAGVLLFLPRAQAYGTKTIFVWKLGLLALAIGAQTLLHARLLRGRDQEPAAPLKGLALLALLLWFATAAAGRAVGFV